MTKTEFTAYLARGRNMPYSLAEKILNAFLDSVEDALYRDGRVALPGFGVFQRQERAERAGRNPATGERIVIAKARTVAFRPAAALKNMLESRDGSA